MRAPLFTVVVCAKDAVDLLPGLHEALAALDEPSGGYEVVLVDDASTDGSDDQMAEFAAGDPRFVDPDHPDFQLALESLRDLQQLAFVFDELSQPHAPADFARRLRDRSERQRRYVITPKPWALRPAV